MNTAMAVERLVLNYRGQNIVLKSSVRRFHLGRDARNNLVVNEKRVSRKHAVIEFQHGHFILTDHSTNGTYLFSDHQKRVCVWRETFTLPQQGIICLGQKPDDQNPDLVCYQRVPEEVEMQPPATGQQSVHCTPEQTPVNLIDRTLTQLTLSPAVQQFRNLTIFPLLAKEPSHLNYLTLDEAVRCEAVRISEVSPAGTVPELQFENRSEIPVLLVDGEELIGMKQNRIVNLTLLIGGHQNRMIPVSCVERKRWSASPRSASTSGQQQYPRARARKAAQVSDSLNTYCSRHSDQAKIWRDIDEKFTTLHGHSETASMADLYDHVADTLALYTHAFNPQPLQVGAVFAIQDRIVGMELFDSDHTWAGVLSKLIRSYALDALEHETCAPVTPNPVVAQQFLERVREARRESYPALGEGEDVRFMAFDISGGALIAEDRVVHLAAFDYTVFS